MEHFRGSCVTALDIAGDEAGYTLDAHEPAFRYAAEHGLARTAHAGEACGSASVWETLQRLAPSRIGHGIRSIEDPTLIDHLRHNHTHLEMCPTSNVQTRAAASYQEHAVDRLYRAGVSVGINTDTRTITNVTLEQEYARLREHFSWSNHELQACNRAALQAAFVDEPTRAHLMEKLQSPSKA